MVSLFIKISLATSNFKILRLYFFGLIFFVNIFLN